MKRTGRRLARVGPRRPTTPGLGALAWLAAGTAAAVGIGPVRTALPAQGLGAVSLPLPTLPFPGPTALAAQQPAPLPGWRVRPDRAGADLAQLAFVDMPPGWHVTTGPAVILYRPDETALGSYRVEMEVFLFDPGSRREAFGFFFGGSDLEGRNQRYTYFLIREGGEFLVKVREGEETRTVVDWTPHPEIRRYTDRSQGESSVSNLLSAQVGEEEIRFFVNGEEVAQVPAAGLHTEGVVGLRVNHGLNLHVSRLRVGEGS